MRMMRRPAVWTVNLVALFFGGTMFAIFAFLPQFSQTPTSAGYGFGVNITGAGLLMLPMLVTMAIGGFVSGPLSKRIGFKTQLAVGASLVAVSALALAFFNTEAWQVALEAGVFGLGIGFVYSSMTSLIVQAVPSSQTGAASGMNANIRNIGGAIGTAVMTTIVTSHPQASGLPTASAYSTAFLVMGLIAVVAVAVSAAVPSANRVARVSRLELATQS
jgi:MFS family permease